MWSRTLIVMVMLDILFYYLTSQCVYIWQSDNHSKLGILDVEFKENSEALEAHASTILF